MEFKQFENKEYIPVIETVRVALFHRGKFLLLQKDASSRNAGAFEFPGGKIDDIGSKTSTAEEQHKAALNEIKEETGINVQNFPMQKVDEYGNYFETFEKDGGGVKKKHKRKIHLFLIRLPDEQDFKLKVNQTKDDKGQSEDRHANYNWVSPEQLIQLATSLQENTTTKEKVHPLATNSRNIKKLLTAVK